MQTKWLRRALRDLDEIATFIAADSPPAATQVIGEIVRQVDLLADQPALGRPGRVPGTRELVIIGLPFIVPYRVRNDTVELLRVMHGARQWPAGFRASERKARYAKGKEITKNAPAISALARKRGKERRLD